MALPNNTPGNEQASLQVRLIGSFQGKAITPSHIPLDLMERILPCLEEIHAQWGNRANEFPKVVQIEEGSLMLNQVVPAAVIGIFGLIAQGNLVEAWQKNRPVFKVVVEIQDIAKENDAVIHIGEKGSPLLIVTPSTDIHIPEEPNWVKVKKVLRGRIDEIGGKGALNIHLTPLTPGVKNPKQIKIETTAEQIVGQPWALRQAVMEVEFKRDTNGIEKDTDHTLIRVYRVFGQNSIDELLEQMAKKSKRRPEFENMDSVEIEREIRN